MWPELRDKHQLVATVRSEDFHGKLCIQNDIAGNVEGLFRDLTDATKDHMVDFSSCPIRCVRASSHGTPT